MHHHINITSATSPPRLVSPVYPFSIAQEQQRLAAAWREVLRINGQFDEHFVHRYGDVLGEHLVSVRTGELSEQGLGDLGILVGHRALLNAAIRAESARCVSGARGDPANTGPASLPAPDVVFSSLNTAQFSGSLSGSGILLAAGSEWCDIEGLANSVDDYRQFIRRHVLRCQGELLFPESFFFAFSGKRPMPYAKFALFRNASCAIAVLRTPKANEVQAGKSTIRSLTDLFIVLLRVEVESSRALIFTAHKRPTPRMTWLGTLKEQVKDADHTPTYEHLMGHLFREVVQGAVAPLDEIRIRTDALASTRVSFKPTKVVEQLLLKARQAQSLRRALAGNIRVLVSWRDKEELHLGDDLLAACECATALQEVAEEIETVAFGHMDVRISLVGFRSQENLKLFTYLSVITQPLTLLTGWYGMNWAGMSEYGADRSYYWFILGAGCLLIGMIVVLKWFTRDVDVAGIAGDEEVTEVHTEEHSAAHEPSSP